MARNNRKTDAASKPAPDSPTNGPPHGDGLDFDAWVERVRAEAGGLHPFVWVAESGADGRSFGSRLGKVPLLPLEDLDERIRDQWPGPRVLILRTKEAPSGHIKHTARLALAGSAAPAAPTATGDVGALAAMLAAQAKQIADLTARLTHQPAPPAAPLGEQVGALASVAQVFAQLKPGGDAQAKGLTFEDVQRLINLGKESTGGTSLAVEALRAFGPDVGMILKASATMLAQKVADKAAKDDK